MNREDKLHLAALYVPFTALYLYIAYMAITTL